MEELNNYIQQYQSGDNNAATPILKDLDSTINSAISSYCGGDQSYKTQARLLALEAAKTFDPIRGANIKTHVFTNLQRLKRISAQRGNLVKISENASLQRAAIARARKDYEIDNGEEPTVEELASMTGYSKKRINDLASYNTVTPDSLTVSPEGDQLASVGEEKTLELYDNYIYDNLDRTDKKIYEWSTGYGGAPVLAKNDMAKKLGITPAAVSKRANKIAIQFNRDRELIRRSLYGQVGSEL